MKTNLDATVFVYQNRGTGRITALYVDDARAMGYRPEEKLVASLEPRTWIQAHYGNEKMRDELLAALRMNAQSLSWLAHGECRGFHHSLPTPDESLDAARNAISKAGGAV